MSLSLPYAILILIFVSFTRLSHYLYIGDAMNFKSPGALTLLAFFSALMALFSQLAIPLGPVPINLASLAVYIGALLLPGGFMALAVLVWLFLGAFGLPVFALFQAGPAHVLGPGGGFIFGYVVAALFIGFGKSLAPIKDGNFHLAHGLLLALAALLLLGLGSLWLALVTGIDIRQALAIAVLPYMPGELVKIGLSLYLFPRLIPLFERFKRG